MQTAWIVKKRVDILHSVAQNGRWLLFSFAFVRGRISFPQAE
jgi:hypothetical protein